MRLAGASILLSGVVSLGAGLLAAQASGGLSQRTPEGEAAARKAERRLVLDVQVTAADGSAVRGLAEKDFVVRDGGQAVPLTSFRELGGEDGKAPAEAVLLLDTMNATFSDVTLMRQELDKLLRGKGGKLKLPMTIVFLTDTGIQIDKPSQDGNKLADELDGVHSPLRVLTPAMGVGGAQDRLARSLRALQMLMRYSGDRPTRKLVIWVGPGWPLLSGPNVDLSERDHRAFFDEVVETTTALRRARFTVYSVAPLNFSQGSAVFPFLYEGYMKGVTKASEADSPDLAAQVLAVHSGGLVYAKSGDLAGEIERCLADADSWYEIAVDAAAASGARYVYHPLKVETRAPGAKARTQTSYYAGLPEAPFADGAAARVKTADVVPAAAGGEPRTVLLDVLVRDRGGAPVRGLKAGDFALEEDGEAKTVESVEEHERADLVYPAAAAAGAGSVEVSNRPPKGSEWNVLAVDLLNTSKEERGRVLKELQELARGLPQSTPVALVLMPGRLRVITTFSEGPAGLLRALSKGLGSANFAATKDGAPAVFERIPNGIHELEYKGNVDLYRQADRAQTTADEIGAMAGWLKDYPGRKNVFWVSSVFPLDARTEMRRELESARVAIYPVDLRGSSIGGGERDEVLGIARATGGKAYFGSDVAKTLAGEIDRGGNYYTLSFAAEATRWDGSYRRLKVMAKEPGLELDYREGYFAGAAPPAGVVTMNEFASALRPGEAAGADLRFTARVVKTGDSAEVEYSLDPATVSLAPGVGGKVMTDVDCALVEFDAKGRALEHKFVHLSGTFSAEQGRRLTAGMLSAKETIALKSGAEVLVIGVRDRATGKSGSVEVRVSSL